MLKICHTISWVLVLGCTKSSNQPVLPVDLPPVGHRIVNVATASALKSALLDAKPADEIVMADGVYNGKFVIEANVSGTVSKPITLRGSRNAILDANSTSTGYVLHLQANYWIIKGFTITNGLKGIMIDGSRHSVIDSVKVNEVMPFPLILTDPLPEFAPVAVIGVAPLNILSPLTWNPVALLPDSLVKLKPAVGTLELTKSNLAA